MLEDNIPLISPLVVDYLKSMYNVNYVLELQEKCKNNDEVVGYMKGVHDIINMLEHQLTKQ